MIVQKCVKGINGISKAEAFDIVSSQRGILSNWWRTKGSITPTEIAAVLTDINLDRHLHQYDLYGQVTPFISLSCGSVVWSEHSIDEYSAIDTALGFATDWNTSSGAVFYCWVEVAMNPSVEVVHLAEEVRNLNTYRRWSPFIDEGEVTAKVHIPSNQIERVEFWDPTVDTTAPTDVFPNPSYVNPQKVSNVRDYF